MSTPLTNKIYKLPINSRIYIYIWSGMLGSKIEIDMLDPHSAFEIKFENKTYKMTVYVKEMWVNRNN